MQRLKSRVGIATATSIGIGLLAIAPIVAILLVLHEVFGHAHLPVEFLHSTFGLVVMDAVLFAEYAVIMVPYFLWGLVICIIAYASLHRRSTKGSAVSATIIGLCVALPLILLVMSMLDTWSQRFFAVALLSSFFIAWGFCYLYIYNRMTIYAKDPTLKQNALRQRRKFLKKATTLAAAFTLTNGGLSYFWHSNRRAGLSAKMQMPEGFPAELTARVYATTSTFEFPENQFVRHSPTHHSIGVCFSSGGPRAMSCAVGQMRGLREIGLLDKVGAISGVSGGSWFATIFNYAPATLSDDTLLGKVIAPEQITLEHLANIDPHMIGAPLTQMTDAAILHTARQVMRSISFSDSAAFNRFYSRLLSESLLRPFGLDDHHRFFTLNDASLNDILKRNPNLLPSQFYKQRKDRPFLIAGSAQVYPLGKDMRMRAFEFTSLYSGMPQYFPKEGVDNTDLGGGYIENFAFDNQAITRAQAATENLVKIPTPEPFFLLSDMIGSSSAGPGIALDYYNEPDLMAEFKLSALHEAKAQTNSTYSVVDGASLEHHGIVPLLRRQYPIIFVFSNALTPLGTDAPNMVDGVSIEISRLFGMRPEQLFYNQPDIQIFPREQFASLTRGLNAAREQGTCPFYIDTYSIVEPNIFDIPAYPNSGKVTIAWFYHDVNQTWLDKLSSEVKDKLNSADPTNRLDNFPFFGTAAQNQTEGGIPQVFYYSPEQINLLADMSSYNITHDAREALLQLVNNA